MYNTVYDEFKDSDKSIKRLNSAGKFRVVEWIVSIVWHDETPEQKKAIESISMEEYLGKSLDSLDFPALLVQDREYSLPGEVLGLIVSNLMADRFLLDNFGLVCELWYVLALSSFKKLTYNRFGMAKRIPLMVLHRLVKCFSFFADPRSVASN